MSDQSVWYEQIDTALVKFLSSNLKVIDNDTTISVPSFVRKAEEDFKVETYPSTSVYCLFSSFDFERYRNETIVDHKNSAGKCLVYHPMLPFKFQYQIDFWTKFQIHKNQLIAQWLNLHRFGTRINLPVTDASGVVRDTHMALVGGITHQDEVSGTQRTFRTIFTYNIWAELDNNYEEFSSIINTVQPNVSIIQKE